MKKIFVIILVCILVCSSTFAQIIKPDSTCRKTYTYIRPISFAIPVIFIGYGISGIENDAIKVFNSDIREEIKEHIDERLTIDDFSQYMPAATVYCLNALSVYGENRFVERTKILTLAYLIMGSAVNGLKYTTNVERPDHSSNNSFPSGHTATVFMGAEFLNQEFKEKSIWYGIAGYCVAGGTGYFRMYNNRHWLTDVLAGAGIGMLSTKLSYLILSKHTKRIKSAHNNKFFLPMINDKCLGFSFVNTF